MSSHSRFNNDSAIRVETVVDGKTVVLEGTARSVEINVTDDFGSVETDYLLDSPKIVRTGYTTTLTAELLPQYTLREKSVPAPTQFVTVVTIDQERESTTRREYKADQFVSRNGELFLYLDRKVVALFAVGRWAWAEKTERIVL